jgi:hypothetical protein
LKRRLAAAKHKLTPCQQKKAGQEALAKAQFKFDNEIPNNLEELQRMLKPSLREPISRILEPRKYYRSLQAVSREVFESSATYLESNATPAKTPLVVSALASSSEQAQNISNRIEEKIRSSTPSDITAQSYSLLQCRNVMQRAIYNLNRLKSTERIFDRLSIIVADRDRPQIARMHSIMLQTVQKTTRFFVHACETAAGASDRDMDKDLIDLTHFCSGVLQRCGLLSKADATSLPPMLIWRLTVHSIDVAVVVYTGSHVKKLTDQFLPDTRKEFLIPGPFAPFASRYPASNISVVPRRLECLSGFLDDSEIWVFHPASPNQASIPKGSLHLSCRANVLADIWGPVSSVEEQPLEDNKPAENSHIDKQVPQESNPLKTCYRLGVGLIVPWKKPTDLTLQDNEVYCHWTETSELDSADRLPSKLDESSILVIGASANLQSNHQCSAISSQDLTAWLRMNGRLLPLKATRPHDYIDSRAKELTMGFSKLAVFQSKLGRTTKPSADVCSWKDSVLSEWSWAPDKQTYQPPFETLNAMIGLQISACTNNARRVPLRTILLADSLRSCFRPGEPQSGDLLEHLDDRKHHACPFSALWKAWNDKPERQRELHTGISDALHRLRHTGFIKEGTSGRTFYAYHSAISPSGGSSYWRVTFPQYEWMQLVKDSVLTGCAAVMVLECLVSDQEKGRKCQAHNQAHGKLEHKSTLETSLLIHRDYPPKGVRWDANSNSYACDDAAKDQKWALESASLSLLDVGIKCTGVLDKHNGEGLATDWRPILGVKGVGSTAVPLRECENADQHGRMLRVFIS